MWLFYYSGNRKIFDYHEFNESGRNDCDNVRQPEIAILSSFIITPRKAARTHTHPSQAKHYNAKILKMAAKSEVLIALHRNSNSKSWVFNRASSK